MVAGSDVAGWLGGNAMDSMIMGSNPAVSYRLFFFSHFPNIF